MKAILTDYVHASQPYSCIIAGILEYFTEIIHFNRDYVFRPKGSDSMGYVNIDESLDSYASRNKNMIICCGFVIWFKHSLFAKKLD